MAGRHWINLWSSSDVLSGIGGLSNLKGDPADGSTAKYRWHWTRRIAVWFSLSLLVPSSAVAFHSIISADYSSALSYVGSVSAAATVQMLVDSCIHRDSRHFCRSALSVDTPTFEPRRRGILFIASGGIKYIVARCRYRPCTAIGCRLDGLLVTPCSLPLWSCGVPNYGKSKD